MDRNSIYTAIVFTACFVMLSLCIAAAFNPLIQKKKKGDFAVLFISLILVNVGEWFGTTQTGGVPIAVMLRIARFVEYSLAPFAALSVVNALGYEKKHMKIAGIVVLVNFALEIASIPTGIVFTIAESEPGVFSSARGPVYWLYALITAAALVYMLIHCIGYSVRYQFRDIGLLVCICVMVVFAFVMQVAWKDFNLGWVCGAFAMVMLYVYYEELIHQIDPLTGLLNRGGFETSLQKVKQPVWIVFFDVDRFKTINDVYGHIYGDEVLKIISTNVRGTFSEWGYCFRYGGDEFCAIIARNDVDLRTLIRAYEDKLDRLRQKDPRLPGISAGFARYDPAVEAFDEAITRADEMMYEEKTRHHAEMDMDGGRR